MRSSIFFLVLLSLVYICVEARDDDSGGGKCRGTTEPCKAVNGKCKKICKGKQTEIPGLCDGNCKCCGRNKNKCSSGFVNVNNECLMFSLRRLSWGAAKADCERRKSTLVVPADFEKLAFYILKNNLFYWQYWVGASDQSHPGNYTWFDNTAVDSDYWYPGYPNTRGVYAGQSCVKLFPSSNTALIASSDTNCNGTNTFRYICEEQ